MVTRAIRSAWAFITSLPAEFLGLFLPCTVYVLSLLVDAVFRVHLADPVATGIFIWWVVLLGYCCVQVIITSRAARAARLQAPLPPPSTRRNHGA